MELIDRFKCNLQNKNLVYPGTRCLVALSGGSDSVALLCLLSEIAQELDLTLEAAHLNHNLRPQAQEDCLFCQKLCQRLGVNLHARSLPIEELAREHKLSLEEAGRIYRYNFFTELKKERNLQIVLTAHTADDQAETVLMRVINGTGLAGLGAIKAKEDAIVRPLLPFSKEELQSYLRNRGQSWCEDHTNFLPDAPRTKVRWQLLPLLRTWNTQIVTSLNRLAENAQEDNQYILDAAKNFYDKNREVVNKTDYYQFCGLNPTENGELYTYALSRKNLQTLHPSVRKRVWSLCYREYLNIYHPSDIKISTLESSHYRALEEFLHVGNGKKLPLPNLLQATWQEDRFIIEELHKEQLQNIGEEILEFRADGPLPQICESKSWKLLCKFSKLPLSQRPKPFSICLDPMKIKELLQAGKRFSIRSRKDGDRFQPAGSTGSQKLKKYLQEIKIPQTMRDQVPILCLDGEIVWIIGQRAEQKFLAKPNQEDVLYIEVEYLRKD